MKDKIDTLIGFALKARKVEFGTDNILKSRRIKLVIICNSLAANAKDKIINYVNSKVPVIISQNPICDIVYKQGVKAVAITDKQMSDAIIKNLTADYLVVGEERSV